MASSVPRDRPCRCLVQPARSTTPQVLPPAHNASLARFRASKAARRAANAQLEHIVMLGPSRQRCAKQVGSQTPWATEMNPIASPVLLAPSALSAQEHQSRALQAHSPTSRVSARAPGVRRALSRRVRARRRATHVSPARTAPRARRPPCRALRADTRVIFIRLIPVAARRWGGGPDPGGGGRRATV